MRFIKKLSENEYRKFWEENEPNHFMQSYEWGKVCEKNRNQIPYYIGLMTDNGKLVAAALLLKKKTPLNMCYFYSPRGFILDYNNIEVLTEFTQKLRKFAKEENAIYIKMDPPIMYQQLDTNANIIEGGKNNYEIYNNLIKLKYKHKGFTKLFDGNQPRYTFRTYFTNYNSFEDVEKSFSKSFIRPVKRNYNYDIEIYETNEVKTFHELIKLISNKDDFKEYSYSYYKNVYDILSKKGFVKIFNAKINPKKLIDKFTKELEKEKKEERRVKIEKDIEFFKEVVKEHDKEYICASLICLYSKKGAWTMYIGNDEVAAYTYTVNRLYYEFYKDAYERGFEFADTFGVVGDPNTKYKNLAGIYEFKRKMGGELIEFIGEFDIVNKPFWYHILPILLKIYRSLKR